MRALDVSWLEMQHAALKFHFERKEELLREGKGHVQRYSAVSPVASYVGIGCQHLRLLETVPGRSLT
jgi:hypothetical protein